MRQWSCGCRQAARTGGCWQRYCRSSLTIIRYRAAIFFAMRSGHVLTVIVPFAVHVLTTVPWFLLLQVHSMKNVKECRDVNRQKSIRTRSGCYRHTSDHTHFGPIAPSDNRKSAMRYKGCIPISSNPNSSNPNWSKIHHLVPTRLKPTMFLLLCKCYYK